LRDWRITGGAFKMSAGDSWDSADAKLALDYYQAWIDHSRFDAPAGAPGTPGGTPAGTSAGRADGGDASCNTAPPSEFGVLATFAGPEDEYTTDFDFGTVTVDGRGGAVASAPLTLANLGDQPLRLLGLRLEGDGAAAYSVSGLSD